IVEKYLSTNADQISLCGDMREYARLWSPYLSCIVPTLACATTYVVCVICIMSISIVQKCFYQFLTIEGFSMLFALMKLCANVSKNNQKVVKENRKFYIIARQRLSMPALFWLRVCILGYFKIVYLGYNNFAKKLKDIN